MFSWLPDQHLQPLAGLGAVLPPPTLFSSGCNTGPAHGPYATWKPDGYIGYEPAKDSIDLWPNMDPPFRDIPKGVSQWNGLITAAALKHGVPSQLVAGIMSLESGGNPKAVSPARAYGLMQLILDTASTYAGRPVSADELLSDPALNVDLGVKFLRVLWDKYGGNPIKISIAYNAGSVKCGAPKKCPDGPNQWNAVADCQDGKAVDYPLIVFGYTNSWLKAYGGGAEPGINLSLGPSKSSMLGIYAVTALAVGAVWLRRRK